MRGFEPSRGPLRGGGRWWQVAVGRTVKPFIQSERLVERAAAIDVVVVEQAHERDKRLDQLVREAPLSDTVPPL